MTYDDTADATSKSRPEISAPKDKHGITPEDMKTLARAWESTIAAGLDARKAWVKAYKEAERFAFESHDFMYEGVYQNKDFRATVPKVWEMINIFGPMVSYRQPHRRIRPRNETQEDPRAPMAAVMQQLLNYTPNEFDWRRETRLWTDQGILGGLGTMWLEQDATTGLVTHLYDDALNMVIDPDATMWRNAYWIARRRRLPRWEVARQLDVSMDDPMFPKAKGMGIEDLYPSSSFQGTEAGASATFRGTDSLKEQRMGRTSETIEVWEVFSKMGIGWRLKEAKYTTYGEEPFDDYPRFFVIPGSGKLWAIDEWPVPLWADRDWPCEFLGWRYRPGHTLPISMIRPVLGMQKALDWFVTMFLQKLKTSSRDFIAIAKDMEEEVVDKIRNGVDLEILDIDPIDLEDKRIQDMVQFLQHPPMNTDLWRIYDLLQSLFERSSGLYGALYSESGPTQSRSATESEDRSNRADLRPDDMRNVVENSHTRMARREAIASRLLYDPEFVGEILGEPAAQIWGEYAEGDLMKIMREYDFNIEVGSTAKPNLEKEHRDALEIFDRAMQIALQVGDFNAINKLMENLQRSRNIPEVDRIYFEPPQPQPDPAQQKAEQEMQLAQQEAEMDGQIKMRKAEIDDQIRQLEAQLKMRGGQQDAQVKKQLGMLKVMAEMMKGQQSSELHAVKMEQAAQPATGGPR
jgi:hypothetical protein